MSFLLAAEAWSARDFHHHDFLLHAGNVGRGDSAACAVERPPRYDRHGIIVTAGERIVIFERPSTWRAPKRVASIKPRSEICCLCFAGDARGLGSSALAKARAAHMCAGRRGIYKGFRDTRYLAARAERSKRTAQARRDPSSVRHNRVVRHLS